MEAKEFYQFAVQLMQNTKKAEPQLVSGSDAEFCMIVTAKTQTIYAGVTSVKVEKGKIMRSCPEFNAIMAMFPSKETLIEKLITISFSTMEISQPCESCLELLYMMNPENKNTQIFTAPDKSVCASELSNTEEQPESAPEQSESSGFAASAPAAAAPPTAMKPAPKNPLASASDFNGFGDFSADGGFGGFEAADPVEEPDEPEEAPVQEQAQQANPDNPFFNPAPPPGAAPQTMAQPYGYPQAQPYGYPQQQYGYPPQNPYAQQSMYIQPGQQSMYIQPGQPQQQSMYMQPNQPQSMYIQPGQQSMYVQPNQQSMYIQPNQPVASHSQQVSAYQQPNYYAQPGVAPPKPASATFKNRLANFMDDSDDPSPKVSQADALSRKELERQAKEQKRLAKMEAKLNRKK